VGGASRAFSLDNCLRSLAPIHAAAAAFWALITLAMAVALSWRKGVEPADFLKSDSLKLLPNQIIYALVGLGMGIIYAQNAFHVVLDPQGEMVLDALGDPIILGSIAESLRGIFAVLSLTAVLGVAWYFSGKNIELLEAYDRSTEVLVTHLEKREPYLDGHAVRVAGYVALIARHMRFPLYEVNRLRHAALLHDLGRAAVPLDILLQTAPLSEEEFEKIKVHPLEGGARLEEVEYLADMAEAVRHHHEYYDGGGYIDHLAGDTIPLTARIIAVADAYDSMMNRRPWREAKGRERALAELRENSGRQFDPEVVEHFMAALEEAEMRESEAAYMPQEVTEAQAEAVEQKAGRGTRRRPRRREELMRERREARERLEREAMRSLEDAGTGEAERPQEGSGGELRDTPQDQQGGGQDEGGGAR